MSSVERKTAILPPAAARLAVEEIAPILSRIVPLGLEPLPLKKVETASLERAWELDRSGGGGKKWEEAACHFYTIYSDERQKAEVRAEAGIVGLPQVFINLGKFGQARKWLKNKPWEVIHQIEWAKADEDEGRYYRARRLEKLAWIDDYEGDFRGAINKLHRARELVEEIPEEKRRKREEELLSTITHFSGRGHFGLVVQGVEREENLKKAINYFQEDLARYQDLREKGEPIPVGEGFNHGWLARCYLAQNREAEAEREIELAGQFFESHTQKHQESGVKAHYYLLKGSLAMQKDETREAREQFEKALEIRRTVEPYRKGEADAAAGIAFSYIAEGKYGAAFPYAVLALKKFPFYLSRGVF